jgi:hypothetical protein
MSIEVDTSVGAFSFSTASVAVGAVLADKPVAEAQLRSRNAALAQAARNRGQQLLREYAPDPELSAAHLARATVESVRVELLTSRAKAIDVVYDTLDPLLIADRIQDAGIVLRAIAQNKLPLAVLLSALTVSAPWRAILADARQELSAKARALAEEIGGQDKVAELSRFF